jgi:hypothetical protein
MILAPKGMPTVPALSIFTPSRTSNHHSDWLVSRQEIHVSAEESGKLWGIHHLAFGLPAEGGRKRDSLGSS